ncbi:MAG: PilZ domain-containing protein [Pseudomonadota bacterium]
MLLQIVVSNQVAERILRYQWYMQQFGTKIDQSIGPEGEQRGPERQTVSKSVKLVFGQTLCTLEGVIKNISDSGALIVVPDEHLLPDEFTIYNEIDAYKVDGNVVRRRGAEIGVMFTSARQPLDMARIRANSTNEEFRNSAQFGDQTASPQKRRAVFGKLGSSGK